MTNPIITLTTDFGHVDSYVAQMKGVILSLCSRATIVDISHQVPSFDIKRGAVLLAKTAPVFPPGTIHVGVIDPGVGSDRKRIIIETFFSSEAQQNNQPTYFVGPDNGLFSFVTNNALLTNVWEIKNTELFPQFANSVTFDGRNIFAPAAALIASGKAASEFGPPLGAEIVQLAAEKAVSVSGNSVIGEIVSIDKYGNAISNLRREHLGKAAVVTLGAKKLSLAIVGCYQNIPAGKASALINSDGLLEIAAGRASAAEILGVRVGELVEVGK